MINAVIFDMDGLLIDSEPFWREAEVLAFGQVGIALTEDDCVQTIGLRLDEVVDYWYRQHPWHSISRQAVGEVILAKYLDLVAERGQAKTGVMETLEFLRAQNVRMAIGSSSYIILIEAVVRRLGIADYFDALCSAEFEPFGKPHPGVYITAAQKLGVSRQECLVFEDSLRGVLAAKAAEMKCVCVPDPSLVGDRRLVIADHVIPTLAHFDEALWAALSS
jgi:sugar-phosphatase